MKEILRNLAFVGIVVGCFIWAVAILDWLVQEERTYRRRNHPTRGGRPRYE